MKILQVLPAILVLVVWQLVVGGDQRLEFLFASPLRVLAVALEELRAPAIWVDIATTLSEAALGLVAGALLGSLVGLLLWTNDVVAGVARPYIVFLGAIPIFAIAPMLIIWFGTGLLSKVVMSAFSVFFVSLAQAYDGARYCASEYSQYAATLRVPRMVFLRIIVLPGAIRWVAAGFKISIGLALVGAFIGEFVSSQAGLGHYMLSAGSLYDMPRVIFGVMLISMLALLLTGLIWALERWQPQLFAKNSLSASKSVS